MKDKRTDKIDQLKEFRVQLDKEALWAELESRQKKEKRRWIFWLLPGLFVIGGLLFWVTQMNEIDKQQKSITTEKVSSDQRLDNNEIKETETTPINTDTENTKVGKSENSTDSIIITDNNQPPTLANHTNQQPIPQPIEAQPQQQSKLKGQLSSSLQSNVPRTSFLETTELKNKSKTNFLTKASSGAATISKSNFGTDAETKASLSQKSLPLSDAISSVKRESIQTLLSLTSFVESKNNRDLKTPVFAVNKKSESKAKTKLNRSSFIELYSGVGLVSRKLTNPIEPYENYTKIRATTEKPLDAFHLGLKYGYNLGKHYYLTTGLEFLQITERFSFTKSELTGTETRDTTVVTSQFIDASGDTTATNRGLQTGGTYSNVSHNIYNRLRHVSIPLAVGWKTTTGKWNFGLNAGVDVSMAFGFKGTILDSKLELDSDTDLFRNRLGLSWNAGLDVGYSIQDNFSLFVRPSFRSVPNIIDGSQSTVLQKYMIYKLGVGLRYEL